MAPSCRGSRAKDLLPKNIATQIVCKFRLLPGNKVSAIQRGVVKRMDDVRSPLWLRYLLFFCLAALSVCDVTSICDVTHLYDVIYLFCGVMFSCDRRLPVVASPLHDAPPPVSEPPPPCVGSGFDGRVGSFYFCFRGETLRRAKALQVGDAPCHSFALYRRRPFLPEVV